MNELATKPFPDPSYPFRREVQGGPWELKDREANGAAVLQLLEGQFGVHLQALDVVDPTGQYLNFRRQPGQMGISRFPGWVAALSGVYSSRPWRTFKRNGEETSPEVAKKIQDIYDDSDADAVLQTVERFVTCVSNVVMRVWWDTLAECAVLDIWPAPRYRVMGGTRVNDPSMIIASVDRYTNLVMVRDANREWSWSTVEVRRENANTNQTGATVPAEEQAKGGRYSVIHFSKGAQTNASGYFLPMAGLPLGCVSMALIELMNAIGNVAMLQGHSMAVAEGDVIGGEDVKTGPGAILKFPAASPESRTDFRFVTPDPHMQDLMDFYHTARQEAQESHSIPATLLDASGDSSGKQTVEARAPIIEARKAASQNYRKPENMMLRAFLTLGVEAKLLDASEIGDVNEWTVDVGFVDPATEQLMEDDAESEQEPDDDVTGVSVENAQDEAEEA